MKRPPVIVVQLVHIQGPLKGQIQDFSDPLIIVGRHPDCHVCFPADLTIISRKHAEIAREGNQFKLNDHSANGTFVNGKPVKEVLLKDGDVLEFAKGGPKISFLTQVREEKEEKGHPMPKRESLPFQLPKKEAPPPQAEVPPPVERGFREIQKPEPPPPFPEEEKPVIQSVRAPLIIQFGPTLRSYKQLPVTIGKDPKCDFKLDHPSILGQHAQIFFSQSQYWVKDLTGTNSVRLNGRPTGLQAPLKTNDELALSPAGPVFRFLGEGRLAEIEEPEKGPEPPGPRRATPERPAPETKTSDGLFSRVKKIFES